MKQLPFPLLALLVFLMGCTESANDHFCSKYSYFYNELTEPDVLPHSQIRLQMNHEIATKSGDMDRAKMALFVLDDIEKNIKRADETPREYCMRTSRWERYQ